jgi:hypothetical protein
MYHDNMLARFSIATRTHTYDWLDDEPEEPRIVAGVQLPTILEQWADEFQLKSDVLEVRLRDLVHRLNEGGWNIIPYHTLHDMTVSAQQFIEFSARGLIFRVFIPNERLWSREAGRLVRLFQDYVSNIAGIKAQLVESRTDAGVTLSMFAPDQEKGRDLAPIMNDFYTFLDVCANDPSQAEKLLSNATLPPQEAAVVVSRYGKEARRLQLDLRHEYEAKILSIRHRLEADLLEQRIEQDVTSLLQATMPEPNIAAALDPGGRRPPGNVTINYHPQFIETASGVIASSIRGDVNYSPQDKQLASLFEKYSSTREEVLALRSALDELKDKSVGEPARITAWQRIQQFLAKSASKIGDVGVELLLAYVKGLAKGA